MDFINETYTLTLTHNFETYKDGNCEKTPIEPPLVLKYSVSQFDKSIRPIIILDGLFDRFKCEALKRYKEE